MKKLLKVLGILAGLYLIADAGCVIGTLMTTDVLTGNIDENDKWDRRRVDSVDAVNRLFGTCIKKRKSNKSEEIRDFIKVCVRQGYSNEEIKEMVEKYYR